MPTITLRARCGEQQPVEDARALGVTERARRPRRAGTCRASHSMSRGIAPKSSAASRSNSSARCVPLAGLHVAEREDRQVGAEVRVVARPAPRAARRTGRARRGARRTHSAGRRPRCRPPAPARACRSRSARVISACGLLVPVGEHRPHRLPAHGEVQVRRLAQLVGQRARARGSRAGRRRRCRTRAGRRCASAAPSPPARGRRAGGEVSSSRASASALLEVRRSARARSAGSRARSTSASGSPLRCASSSARALSASTRSASPAKCRTFASRACSCGRERVVVDDRRAPPPAARCPRRRSRRPARSPRAAERGLGEQLGEAVRAGELGRARERRAPRRARRRGTRRRRARAAARSGARSSPCRAARARAGSARPPPRRPARRACSAACDGVVDRLALAIEVAALEVVVGELGGRRARPTLLQRLRDPVVQRARGGSRSGARRASRARARARRRSGRRRPRPR